ncbi:MAG: electron transfer flavoprotein subunit beta/FixA family protein [Candidatus Marinimicrobia bacterium]|nr:electron transfer flavoprotein subunit beta/FixA family protein [Candidatus Neomarinimicrobiota bacterium]MCF7827972.1 electron transfer flavoprotein subunit beta/FixA family protein [Candidatus Neomarinimicrobiota bacterium]MCF7879273.1 electron transfer flavoprotein subunit beta/FixA family protein [Candidatus Neomarinimicrobiota bacterium]
MNILVCIKQVPDTETKVKIGEDGKSIDESDVNFVLNPYDEFAVEEALQLKEAAGGEVTVITVGPESATSAMRTALAMGADKGIRLDAEDVRLKDSFSIARALATSIEELDYDVIFCGKKAVDDDNHQVGPMLSALLDIPCVSTVTQLEIEGTSFTATREVEGGREIYEGEFPAVFTTDKGLNEPRYAALKGIMQAKKKPIDVSDVQFPEADSVVIESMEMPPESPPGRILGDSADAVPELIRLLKEEAKVL